MASSTAFNCLSSSSRRDGTPPLLFLLGGGGVLFGELSSGAGRFLPAPPPPALSEAKFNLIPALVPASLFKSALAPDDGFFLGGESGVLARPPPEGAAVAAFFDT
uniref:Uncharacterized protein n=1 Tax=Cacopsylla melanoneura TaxID=428564 RepID=A0A8D9AHU9_9HEMI